MLDFLSTTDSSAYHVPVLPYQQGRQWTSKHSGQATQQLKPGAGTAAWPSGTPKAQTSDAGPHQEEAVPLDRQDAVRQAWRERGEQAEAHSIAAAPRLPAGAGGILQRSMGRQQQQTQQPLPGSTNSHQQERHQAEQQRQRRAKVPPHILPLTLQGRLQRMLEAAQQRQQQQQPQNPKAQKSIGQIPASVATAVPRRAQEVRPAAAGGSSRSAAPQGTSNRGAARAAAGAAVAAASIQAAATGAELQPLADQPTQNLQAQAQPANGRSNSHSKSSSSSWDEGRVQAIATEKRTRAAARPAIPDLPPDAATAGQLMDRLAQYRPTGHSDSVLQLALYARYRYAAYEQAAEAATVNAKLLLDRYSLSELAAIAAAYAAARHVNEKFVRALVAAARARLAEAAALIRNEQQRLERQGVDDDDATDSLDEGTVAARIQVPELGLTFRTAATFAVAFERLGAGAVAAPLLRALALWLAKLFRSGALTPRARAKGVWLAAGLRAYARMGRYAGPELGRMFQEAAEMLEEAPGWLGLLHGLEPLWLVQALRTAGVKEPLLELQLLQRAVGEVPRLDPAQLAEAAVLLVECGGPPDVDLLAALRRSSMAKAASLRPQVLTTLVAALACLQVRDVDWLSTLALACRSKMINFQAEQVVVLLRAFSLSLGFHHRRLMRAAAAVATLPSFRRLDALAASRVVALVEAYASAGHYDWLLLQSAVARVLSSGEPPASLHGHCAAMTCHLASLRHRNGALLRAACSPGALSALVDASTPPARLVQLTAGCAAVQSRPAALLGSIHAAWLTHGSALTLHQLAGLAWSMLQLLALPLTRSRSPTVRSMDRRSDGHEAPAGSEGGDASRVPTVAREVISAYLGALADAPPATWPSTTTPHRRLLAACCALAVSEDPQRKQRRQTAALEPEGVADAGAGDDAFGWLRPRLRPLDRTSLQAVMLGVHRERVATHGSMAREVAAAAPAAWRAAMADARHAHDTHSTSVRAEAGVLLLGGALYVDVVLYGSDTAEAPTPGGAGEVPARHSGTPPGAARVASREPLVVLELCRDEDLVSNSKWLLAGHAAVRRRVLAARGWPVVVVRDRRWRGLATAAERQRHLERLMRVQLGLWPGAAFGMGAVDSSAEAGQVVEEARTEQQGNFVVPASSTAGVFGSEAQPQPEVPPRARQAKAGSRKAASWVTG